MAVKIIGVTSSGLEPADAQKYGITIVPLRVNFGMETLRDGVDISKDEFLRRLAASKIFPTTSQPPAGDFLTLYQQFRAEGHDVLCVVVSNKLSGTWLSANTAKQQLDDDHVMVFDTLNVAAGEAMMLIEAARLANTGQTIAEILPRLEVMRDGMKLYFVLDTLEYLAKGGRVGNAQAFIGSVLKMKPILEIRNGLVEGAERIRTRAKAQARLRTLIAESMQGKSRAQMCVLYTGLPDRASEFASELKQTYQLADCPIYAMSPAVSAHTGSGALGFGLFVEK
ncbi:MAG TPA: DegV family protein [Anaerolineae bacterium]|nr:DegV family protein [Anaerolineae bacterium]